MKTFSNRLIALRKEQEMTQVELANAIKMSRSTLSGYETENREPDYDTLCHIAKYFGVSVDYLLGVEDCRNHNDIVFVEGSTDFKKHYDDMPYHLRYMVSQMYDNFCKLIMQAVVGSDKSKLDLFAELFGSLEENRAKILSELRGGSNGGNSDALKLSSLMSMQTAFKNDICALLDKLMQADITSAYNLGGDADRAE